MSKIKTLKGNFRTQFMQITYKICLVKYGYEKDLKEVTSNLRKVFKKVLKH